jgi:tetratricopeptide (TPR) repeat protein
VNVNAAVPGPGEAQTPAEFVERLRSLKAWSGRSYRALEKQARRNGDILPASTIATALKRDSLPHIDLVGALVRACGGGAAEVDAWTAARRALAQPATPGWAEIKPCHLPPDRPRFVGRAEELAAARLALASRPATLLLTGAAGIGKTTLAVRIGHLVADAFPDGRLYVDLDGMSGHPVDPVGVLAVFLRSLGVPGAAIPDDPTSRIHLYRTLLAQRQVLVVLDNAADGRQVRDLLPNGPGCAAIVTSRTSLAGIDGTRLPLGLLTETQALSLLRDMAGEERTTSDPAAATAIVEMCGGLPLAVWVAGARLAARPHWPLDAMARALTDEHRKLDELTVGDIAVRASLELTYQGLNPHARKAFRLLGRIGSPDFAPWALAALLDAPLHEAEALLDALIEVHLVEAQPWAGGIRYRLHDLVRLFAHERSSKEDDGAAVERLLGAALHLAEAAGARINADFQGITRHRIPHWTVPAAEVDELLHQPLQWLDGERTFLVGLAERGLNGATLPLAACLAISLTTFFQVRSHFDDWRRLHGKALAATQAQGDRVTASKLHRALGELDTIQDRYPEAVVHFEAALRAVTPDDPEYTASSLAGLAYVYRLLGRYAAAVSHFESAAELARATGNMNCLIYVTCGIGVAELEQGNLAPAKERLAEAVRLSRLAEFRPGEAHALSALGHAHRRAGEHREAVELYERAAEISGELGDQLNVTHAHCWLGFTLVHLGRAGEGTRLMARSLWTYRATGNKWGEAAALYGLAHAHLAAGNPKRAKDRALGAVRLWRGVGSPYWLGAGLDTLVDAAHAAGDCDTAEQAVIWSGELVQAREDHALA